MGEGGVAGGWGVGAGSKGQGAGSREKGDLRFEIGTDCKSAPAKNSV